VQEERLCGSQERRQTSEILVRWTLARASSRIRDDRSSSFNFAELSIRHRPERIRIVARIIRGSFELHEDVTFIEDAESTRRVITVTRSLPSLIAIRVSIGERKRRPRHRRFRRIARTRSRMRKIWRGISRPFAIRNRVRGERCDLAYLARLARFSAATV